jgi:hypothetical protein
LLFSFGFLVWLWAWRTDLGLCGRLLELDTHPEIGSLIDVRLFFLLRLELFSLLCCMLIMSRDGTL